MTTQDRTDAHQVTAAWLLAVGLLSAAMLALELALTRLLALAQYYHFAFMVVSLALLGLGAAGSLLTVRPRLGARPDWAAVGFTATALASLAVLNTIPFDSFAIAWDRRQVLYLVLTFVSAALPFVCAGVVVGALLAANPARLHRVYGSNLVGSALGSLVALPLLTAFGGEGTLVASAAFGLVAAALLSPARVGLARGAVPIGLASAAAALLAVTILRPSWLAVHVSPYKGLSQALRAADARPSLSRWDAAVRVDVVESRAIHVLPGLSDRAIIPRPPEQAGLTLDGDDLVPITALAPTDPLAGRLASQVPEAILDLLRPAGRRLIVNPGGGWPVLMALAGGGRALTVVERNPRVVEILQQDYDAHTFGLYSDPRVRLVVADERTFLRRQAESFDAVVVALSDAFHPVSSGAFSLTEDYRYTVEAFVDRLDHLAPSGLLVVTRWLQAPPTECVRTLATIVAAQRRRGVARPGDHLAAFRSLRTMTFIATQAPLTAAERATIREFAAARGYDLVWLPDLAASETNRHYRQPEPIYHAAFAALLADPDGFVRGYGYDIRPPTDDRPFFFHYFRWRQTREIMAGLGRVWQPFGGSGYLVLVALLVLVGLLGVLFILGPLVLGSPDRGPGVVAAAVRWRVLAYFALLGLGYLFVLIPLSQRFIIYVGRPVSALAVVFFAILLSSGLGSLSAPRWRLELALPLLVALIIATPLVLGRLFDLTLGWPQPARVVLTLVVLAPLGGLMGIPFARGLARVEAVAPGLTPWAWAINGSASVVASVLAVMIALGWGFAAVIWAAAGAYALALPVVRGLGRS